MSSETTAEDQSEIIAENQAKGLKTNQAGDKSKNLTNEEMDTVGSNIPNVSMTSKQVADAYRESRRGDIVGLNPGYGMLPGITPLSVGMNAMGKLSQENIAKAIEGGGLPVYDIGNGKISVGYSDKYGASQIVGVQHTGIFGGTVYSGQNQFNPANWDKDGKYTDPFDNDRFGGGDNEVSTLGSAVQATKPMATKKVQEFAMAVNKNPQEQLTKVKKPKAAGGEFEQGGALVRRTKTLQSDRRGILGKPDTGKKTLLGA